MNLAWEAALAFTAPTLVLCLLAAGVQWLRKRPVRGLLRGTAWAHAMLFVLHLFVTFPLVLGWFGVHGFGSGGMFTRGDERLYAGPRIGADGKWQLQTADTLRAEARGDVRVDPAIAEAAKARAVSIPGADGVQLRAFRVEARQEPPRAIALLVHGLFRGGMELEPPANMFRRLGCECWLLEQRGHGGSAATPLRFDDSQARDLVEVVRWLRQQPGKERAPIVLFGVSIGSVAVLLALPQLQDIAGVVVDAPVEDLLATARRMMTTEPPGTSRRPPFAEPWCSLVLAAVELWSGCRLGDVAPMRVLSSLPHDLPMLVIGGGQDHTVPPAVVQSLYDNLPMPEGTKSLWIDPAAAHGKAWKEDPAGYERQLGLLLARLRTSPR